MKYEVWRKYGNKILISCKKTSNFTDLDHITEYKEILDDIKFDYPYSMFEKIEQGWEYQHDVRSIKEFWRKYCNK